MYEASKKRVMKRIILDTNFILAIAQFRIDIFEEIKSLYAGGYEIFVPKGVIKELEKLINGGSLQERRFARLGKELLEKKQIRELGENKLNVDDFLLELGNKYTIIATQDKPLRKRLKEKKAKILGIRQKKYLVEI